MNKFLLKLIAVVLAILFLVACTPQATPAPVTQAPAKTEAVAPTEKPTEPPTETIAPTVTPVPVEAAVVLELSGPGGQKSFTMDDLKKLVTAEGQAGMKSSTGQITLPALYKGVTLEDLAKEVGGLDPSLGVNIVAKDGYAMTFSYDQITQGNFITYDPATGDEKKTPEPLNVLIAFERDGQPLPEDSEGTLRLVIVSDKNDQVTDGHWAVKWVNKIELKPLGQEWSLKLNGVITDVVDRNSFQSCAAANCHQGSWTDDKAQKWVGVPLWFLIGRVDDSIKHEGPAFFDALADAGYTIQIISTDGYSITLNSVEVKRNNQIVLAYQVNDNPLPDKYAPLRLVGPTLQKNQFVGQVAEIKMNVDPAVAAQVANVTPVAPAPTIKVSTEEVPTIQPTTDTTTQPIHSGAELTVSGMVEKELSLIEVDLKKLEVVEVTAEHPKKGTETYQGIRLNTLLSEAGIKSGATKLVFIAVDGYTAEVDLTTVQACKDCLVAFTNTPGKFKMVMPGLDSAAWVKDIVQIEIQ
jgi:DMSO/TMAO reductase YedYZ molybdopterin-dependent catalytic subunit